MVCTCWVTHCPPNAGIGRDTSMSLVGASGYDSSLPNSVETKRLGSYFEPAFDVGDALCARILTDKGKSLSMEHLSFHLAREKRAVMH